VNTTGSGIKSPISRTRESKNDQVSLKNPMLVVTRFELCWWEQLVLLCKLHYSEDYDWLCFILCNQSVISKISKEKEKNEIEEKKKDEWW